MRTGEIDTRAPAGWAVPMGATEFANCTSDAANAPALAKRFGVGAAAAASGPNMAVQLDAVSDPSIVRPSC